MGCKGIHCPGCTDSTSLIPAAALAAGVWFTVRYGNTITQVVDDLLITAGAVVGIVLALTVVGLIRLARRESFTRISWHRQEIPADPPELLGVDVGTVISERFSLSNFDSENRIHAYIHPKQFRDLPELLKVSNSRPPMLTAEQVAGLAQLGQAIHEVQAAAPVRAKVTR